MQQRSRFVLRKFVRKVLNLFWTFPAFSSTEPYLKLYARDTYSWNEREFQISSIFLPRQFGVSTSATKNSQQVTVTATDRRWLSPSEEALIWFNLKWQHPHRGFLTPESPPHDSSASSDATAWHNKSVRSSGFKNWYFISARLSKAKAG